MERSEAALHHTHSEHPGKILKSNYPMLYF